MMVPRSLLVVLILLAAVGSPAAAEIYTVTVTPTDLGTVAGGATGTTTFQTAPGTGTVTKLSGSAVRVSTGTARSLVTVSCTSGTGFACGLVLLVSLHITQTGTPTNRANALQNFTVSTAGGTATIPILNGPGTGNSIHFQIAGMPSGASRTFYVGFDFPLSGDDSTAASGTAAANFLVTADGAAGSTPGTGAATAKVVRSLKVTNTSGLVFGKIIRPRSGSGTVTLAAATGTVTATGGALKLATPTSTAAVFPITGEGGQSISISVPTAFTMASGANTIPVTLASTLSGTQTLSGSVGVAGTLTTRVGGSFGLTSTTPSGAYSGTFAVTVIYN